jgi:CcmD family protein
MPDANGYIVAAYVLTWSALIGYAVHLERARREAERRWHAAVPDPGESPQ